MKSRVAYVTASLSVNGISNVVMNYCENIDKEQFDVVIISGTPISEQYKIKCKNLNIKIYEIPSKTGKSPIKFYFNLIKILKKEHFNIIHIHGNSATIVLEILIAKICGIKTRIAHSHNTTCNHLFIHKLLRRYLNKIATDKLACGEDAGKWMYGNEDFQVIPNGIDTKKYLYNEKKRNELRKKLNLENKFIIGHVGRFNEQKNHPFMIEFFENFSKKHDDAILFLIGVGPNYQAVKKIVDSSTQRDKIILYGETDSVHDLYNIFDLFVLPSKYEGLPFVLIEAQTNGLKSVVSDKITKECDFTKQIDFLGIDDIKLWENKIDDLYNKYDISERYISSEIGRECIEKNNYDLYKNVKMIERIYKQGDKNEKK